MEPQRPSGRRRRRSQNRHRVGLALCFENLRSLLQPQFHDSRRMSQRMLLRQAKAYITQLENSIASLIEQNAANGSLLPDLSTLSDIQAEFVHQHYSARGQSQAGSTPPPIAAALGSPAEEAPEAAGPSAPQPEAPVADGDTQLWHFTADGGVSVTIQVLEQQEDSYLIHVPWLMTESPPLGLQDEGVCDPSRLLQCTESFDVDEM